MRSMRLERVITLLNETLDEIGVMESQKFTLRSCFLKRVMTSIEFDEKEKLEYRLRHMREHLDRIMESDVRQMEYNHSLSIEDAI